MVSSDPYDAIVVGAGQGGGPLSTALARDERLETNVEGIYALGDVNGDPAFTHIYVPGMKP